MPLNIHEYGSHKPLNLHEYENTGRLRTLHGSIWTQMDPYGPMWVMGSYGPMTHMGPYGLIWVHMDSALSAL